MKDANGCTTSVDVKIKQPDAALTASVTASTNETCNEANDGTATVTAKGGTTPYTYLWDDAAAQTSAKATGLSAGKYTVTVTDDNGCFVTTEAVTISQPDALTASVTASTNETCNEANDGTATVTAKGGTTPYTYLWDDAAAQTSAKATGLSAGEYTVTVTDDNGCFVTTEAVTISQPDALTASVTASTNETCNEANDGTATVTAKGGTTPYTYLWDDAAAQTSAKATGLSAGEYTVTVTDDNGCFVTTEAVTISQPDALTASVTASTNETCNEANDGTATVTAKGGTTPYTYLWDDAAAQTSAKATGLSAGEYTVTVTDDNGCFVTTEAVTISQPDALTASVTASTNETCNEANDGTATVTAKGGTTPYTYLWDDAAAQTSAKATGLSAGEYTVTVTDDNGCFVTTEAVTISQPDALTASVTASTNETCNEANDGTATVTAKGGTTPYTYLWDDAAAQTSAKATGLSAGEYTVTVTDDNGCFVTTEAVTISQPDALTASVTASTNETCNEANDGTATVTAKGGTTPYTYLWDDAAAQTSAKATGLSAGKYTVTVTDDNGCFVTTEAVTISQPDALTASVTASTNETCNEANDGTATVTAKGGTTPYTYLWDDAAAQTSAKATGLSAGEYTVTVTDDNGCFVTTEAVTISQPDALTASVTASTNETCNEANDGTVTVTAKGGTTPYTYLWDDAAAQTSAKATGLSAGEYTVTVTDDNGCFVTTEAVTISQPDALTASVTASTNETCNEANDGTATVTAKGGTTPYTYLWDDAAAQTSAKATGLSAGEYTVTVTDDNGCFVTTEAVTISQPDALTASVTASTNETCNEANDGTATVTAKGGTTPYTYLWDDAAAQTSAKATGLSAGEYTVTVTDDNGCFVTTEAVTISQPDALTASVTASTNETCNEANDGTATVTAKGGTTPYTYLWDDAAAQTSAKATGLSAGEYTVTVTDDNGCFVTTEAVTISQPDALTASVTASTNETCNEANDGTATVTAKGGTTPYTYLWDDAAAQTSAKATGLSAGEYTVTVTDDNGCFVTTEAVTISQPDALTASVTASTNETCNEANDGTATVTAKGGTTPYTYLWDDAAAQTSAKATGLSAGEYTVTVTDDNGCFVTTEAVTISQPEKLTCDANQVSQVTIFGHKDGVATVTPDGGTEPYEYMWNNGDERATADTLGAGYHEVTVTDANGCETTCGVTVGQPGELTCDVDLILNVDCNGSANGAAKVTAKGGVGSYYYLWDNGDTRSTADTLRVGTHTVMVTDDNGAETKCEVTINEPDEVVIITPKDSSVSSCLTQQEVDTEFATWLSRVKVSGGNNLSVTNDNNGAPLACGGAVTVTWTASSECPEDVQDSAKFTVIADSEKPTFTVPADITIAKAADCSYNASVEVTGDVTDEADNCDTELNATFSDEVANGDCEGKLIITRTWTLTDDCGNTTEHVQTITVEDQTAPTFNAPADITIAKAADCSYNASVEVTGDVTDEVDNCDTKLNATFSDEVANGDCEGKLIITRTWTLTDDCGNSTEHVQTITVEDQTAPTFNETLPTAEITAECDNVVEAVVLTASDNCDTDVPVVFTETRTDGDCANNYTLTRTWTATDDCDNETSFTQTVVVSDNTAPEITCNDITVQLDANSAATITVDDINGGTTDACSDIDTMYISQATFDCDNVGENEVTLTVIDECGNASTCTATVTVEEGDANCGLQPFKANDDILSLVYCPDETVSGELDLFANDEGFTPENVNFTILTDLPEGVSVTDGNLLYANENPAEAVVTFTYSVCHTVNTENCSTAEVTIQLLVDTDCDGVPDIDDLDDDDDGILDIIEEENALDQTSLDSDGDGIVDRLDIDADNDGIVDNVEWQSTIAEGGEYDYIFPLGTDSNGDGWDDAYDPASNGITYEPWDMDLDGTPDYLDTNTDNEGEDDNVEGWDEFPNDSIADVSYIGSDTDKDGLDDAYDTYNTTTEEWAPGQNAIGSDAYLQDTDDDGVRDWRDAVDDRTPPELFACGDPVIPNAFSPNQDGYNDYFKVMIYCTGTQGGNEERVLGDDFSDARIEIFNRWGTLVYEQERYGDEDYWGDVDAWWNGTSMNNMQVGGNQLPTATYYYILYFNDGKREPITGFVFLNN